MSTLIRAARTDEVDRVWPAVGAAHLMRDPEELRRLHAADPWMIRVTEDGDAALLSAWRRDLDVLALLGLWAPEQRVALLVDDARRVARGRGFSRLLSPLVPESAAAPYVEAGMDEVQRLVVFVTATEAVGARAASDDARIEPARARDAEALLEIEQACFDRFWRLGAAEVAHSLDRDVTLIARDERGVALGYASCTLHGTSATLGRLAVMPHARRRGVAAALTVRVVANVASRGALGVSLCTQEHNGPSRALYASLGFTEQGERHVLLEFDTGLHASRPTQR